MAIEIVPAYDERCDVCAGQRDRPRPKPGEPASVRPVVHRMCEACFADFRLDVEVDERIVDPTTREVEGPEDPSRN